MFVVGNENLMLSRFILSCSGSSFVRVCALRFRSQKNTASPYRASAVQTHDGFPNSCACRCGAKERGAYHHIVALKHIVLLKERGYEEATAEVSCTELPQKRKRPRGHKMPACSIDELEWRSARCGGLTWSFASRLYEARKRQRNVHDVEEAARKFGTEPMLMPYPHL